LRRATGSGLAFCQAIIQSQLTRPDPVIASIQFFDPEHFEEEDRFILLGSSFNLKTLVVCHCFREDETRVRIISARKADKDEEKYYWSEKK